MSISAPINKWLNAPKSTDPYDGVGYVEAPFDGSGSNVKGAEGKGKAEK